MPEKIVVYAVFRTKGEYSDKRIDLICGFYTEEEAWAFVRDQNEKIGLDSDEEECFYYKPLKIPCFLKNGTTIEEMKTRLR